MDHSLSPTPRAGATPHPRPAAGLALKGTPPVRAKRLRALRAPGHPPIDVLEVFAMFSLILLY